jgi:hypothetical protein
VIAGRNWAPTWLGAAFLSVTVAAAYGAVLGLAWTTMGREVVTVSGGRLTVEHFTWRRVRCLTFEAAGLKVRAVAASTAMRRGRAVRALPCLVLDRCGQETCFGAGLEGAEATRVVEVLTGALGWQSQTAVERPTR